MGYGGSVAAAISCWLLAIVCTSEHLTPVLLNIHTKQ